MTDLRYPVLTGTTIKGKHPRIARWLYTIAYRIEALAVKWDDHYTSPLDSLYADRTAHEGDTITWGNRYVIAGDDE